MRFVTFISTLVTILAIACSGGSDAPDPTPTTTAAAASPESASSPPTTAASAATTEPSSTPEPLDTPEPTATTAPAATATAPPAPTSPAAPTSAPAPTSPPAPAGIPAAIRGYGFPYQLTVPAGSTVVWTNYDAVVHDVTASDDSWSSGLLAEGASFARTFNTPGKYGYVCRVHPYMSAAVIVQ